MPARKVPSPEELRRLYWDEEQTPQDIAAMFGVTDHAVRCAMLRYGIPMRSKSEGLRLALSKGQRKSRERVKTKLKAELLCRQCGASWIYDGDSIVTACPFCGTAKDARDRSEQAKDTIQALNRKKVLVEWYGDSEHRKERGRKHRSLLRKRVFFRVSNSITPACVRCGCDDPRLLEINHKNGGGARETQRGRLSSRFYYDIASGQRGVEDLELLCKACNAIHALELKFGPLPMKVVWEPTQTPAGE